MRNFVLILLMGMFTLSSGSSALGIVEHFSGSVKVQHEGSIKKEKVIAGLEINSGDLIITSKESTAKMKLADGSVLVLDESSSIHFSSITNAEQTGGKILYKITSRDAKNSLQIKTPFAIIGIKGTTFIVNATEDSSISLQEGLIGITSLKEQFELYRKKVQEEFNNYVASQQSEFEKYKNAQNKYAVAESTKSFDLEHGNKVTFDGQKVNEDAWTAADDAEFKRFVQLMDALK